MYCFPSGQPQLDFLFPLQYPCSFEYFWDSSASIFRHVCAADSLSFSSVPFRALFRVTGSWPMHLLIFQPGQIPQLGFKTQLRPCCQQPSPFTNSSLLVTILRYENDWGEQPINLQPSTSNACDQKPFGVLLKHIAAKADSTLQHHLTVRKTLKQQSRRGSGINCC